MFSRTNKGRRPRPRSNRKLVAGHTRVTAIESLEERDMLTGIWISTEEIMALPTTGAAWQNVLDASQQVTGLPNLQDQGEVTDVVTLAKALVSVRLGDEALASEVREAVMGVIGSESVLAENVTITNPNAVETTATFSVPGTYLLRLTADDGEEDDDDELTIRVHADGDTFTPTGSAALDGSGQITFTESSGSNKDPDVYAGADQIVSVNDTVTLRGGVEDDGLPDGNLTVMWEVVESRTLALSRNLVSYVIAADIVGLEPNDDAVFRNWLRDVLTKVIDGRTLQSTQEDRPNNWGTMAAASRAAVAVYLGDQVELDRTAQVFEGYLGNRSAYAGFRYDDDLSWQADPANPVGINPLGATKDGHNIDGAQPEEMRRGASFQFPPAATGYPWEGLQGTVVTAEILHRAGFDSWEWEDQAIRRAVDFLYDLGWNPNRDDKWTPWIIDARYGTDYAVEENVDPGKNMGWTSWTHSFVAPVDTVSPRVAGVKVGASTWTNADFLNSLDAAGEGFPIASGASQLDVVSWFDIDWIAIKLTEAITNVSIANVFVRGTNVDNYESRIASVEGNGTDTVTISFNTPIGSDKLRVTIGESVTDLAGNNLNGEFTDAVSSFPSGDEDSGGDFSIRLNFVPGSVNLDIGVNLTDFAQTRSLIGQTATGGGQYSNRHDVNGDGGINLTDSGRVRNAVGLVLPEDEPPGSALSSVAIENRLDVFGIGYGNLTDIEMLVRQIHSSNPDQSFDLNGDGAVNQRDLNTLISHVFHTTVGDANLDGEFDSDDMIRVAQADEYEDEFVHNSTWAEGDWNGDREFDSQDLILAFQLGIYGASLAAVRFDTVNPAASLPYAEVISVDDVTSARVDKKHIRNEKERAAQPRQLETTVVEELFGQWEFDGDLHEHYSIDLMVDGK